MSQAVPRRPGIGRDRAMRLAAAEYARCADLFAGLDEDQWLTPTANTGWSVRDTAGHMLGMLRMAASVTSLIGQMATSMVQSKRAKAPSSIDHLTALQVRRNAGLSTVDLVGRWRALSPKAVRGRGRLPALLHRRVLPEAQLVGGHLERWTTGFLVDVILTRDPFMHRLDICAAVAQAPYVTADHDGVLVDDIVREWADRHGRPYRLVLTGPAGGSWGTGDAPITMDALDFCRVLSGRGEATGLLATAVPF